MAVGAFGFNLQSYAHERYNSNPPGGNCAACHGNFDGPVSPIGTIFPGGSKHQMHRSSSAMNTECELCHTVPEDNPLTFSSEGTPNTPGLGCVGCHGRDYGVDGNLGAGLRAHHLANGVNQCLTCHPDDPTPLPESVMPPYYGSPDTNAFDSCNLSPAFGENYSIGDTLGLDNDGDNVYDGADTDCLACPWDCGDANGSVGTADLLALLAQWSSAGPCDFDGGLVGTSDLLKLLANWGSCG